MRKIIIILFLPFIFLITKAQTYYVSPTGNNSNPGTEAEPWLTWEKGFTNGGPDITVYFRGGTYPITITNGYGYRVVNSGTAGHYANYFAYPGETPVLDCAAAVPCCVGSGTLNQGIRAPHSYVHFKGLTVANVKQAKPEDEVVAWYFNGGNYNIWEACVVHNADGVGFGFYGGVGNIVRNCDSYDNCDSLTTAAPGNDGAGYRPWNWGGTGNDITFVNCRAWNCGDQGFSAAYNGLNTYIGCWSFNNGQLEGGGHGFKFGWINTVTPGFIHRIYYNNLAVGNRHYGFTTNDGTYYDAGSMRVYNNTAALSGRQGFCVYNTISSDAQELTRDFKNNMSYNNSQGQVFVAVNALYTHTYNSWDTPPGITPGAEDFVSVSSNWFNILSAARNADGSLPDVSGLFHLSSGSGFVHAGDNSTLAFNTLDGDSIAWFDPPSVGAYEQSSPVTPVTPVSLTTARPYWQNETTAISGGNVIDDGGGTVSARGVVWNTTGSPTLADNSTSDGTGTGPFVSVMTGLSQGVTYYIKAYATNQAGTKYDDTQVQFPSSTIRGGQVLGTGGVVLRSSDGKIMLIP